VGIFTPKPINKNTQISVLAGLLWLTRLVIGVAANMWPNSATAKKKPINKKKLPKSVHINISLTASPIRSDFDVIRKIFKDIKSKHSKDTNIIISDLV
jgi:hypothetical protein